jgi:hypothetical protein
MLCGNVRQNLTTSSANFFVRRFICSGQVMYRTWCTLDTEQHHRMDAWSYAADSIPLWNLLTCIHLENFPNTAHRALTLDP